MSFPAGLLDAVDIGSTGAVHTPWPAALVRAMALAASNDNKIGIVAPSIPEVQTGPAMWEPQPGPQSLAIAAQFVTELMFGGARGGGKSDFLLGDFLQDIHLGSAWCGILFRRSYPELEELIKRAKEIFAWYGAIYKVQEKMFTFPSGATLKMRHIETEADADKYQGHQYTWIGWDELGNWPNLNAYKKLKACLRNASQVIPNKRIRASANPGGVGHHEVKHYFINPAPKGMELIVTDNEDGTQSTRMFIPSRVYDNKILLRNDPGYINRLREIGSPELVRAWLEGDWNVITGAYFPEFRADRHVIEPFAIPAWWMRFRSCDWGSATPFAVLWHAVSDGYQVPGGPFIPAGAIVTYREWYGWNGHPNQGLRWPATRIGAGIKKAEEGEKISYGVIDPMAYSKTDGPSHAERMAMAGAYFRKADNNRIGGWDMVRDRLCGLDGDPDKDNGVGIPMWYVFKTCVHIIRTLPAMQHDLDNPEDADSDTEDHAPDALRYGFMSRPWKRPKPAPANPMGSLAKRPRLDDLWKIHEEGLGHFRQL
jgi:hypothetical protein